MELFIYDFHLRTFCQITNLQICKLKIAIYRWKFTNDDLQISRFKKRFTDDDDVKMTIPMPPFSEDDSKKKKKNIFQKTKPKIRFVDE